MAGHCRRAAPAHIGLHKSAPCCAPLQSTPAQCKGTYDLCPFHFVVKLRRWLCTSHTGILLKLDHALEEQAALDTPPSAAARQRPACRAQSTFAASAATCAARPASLQSSAAPPAGCLHPSSKNRSSVRTGMFFLQKLTLHSHRQGAARNTCASSGNPRAYQRSLHVKGIALHGVGRVLQPLHLLLLGRQRPLFCLCDHHTAAGTAC